MGRQDQLSGPNARVGIAWAKSNETGRPLRHESERQKYRGRFITADEELRILKKSIEAVSTGITIAEIGGRIVYTNPAEANMHGYKVEEIIGKDVGVFSSGREKDHPKAKEAGQWKEWVREVTNVRRDGATFPVQLKSIPIHGSDGKPSHIITISENITERKRAEEILRSAYDKLEEKIAERTSELREANQRLETELGEKKKAEGKLRILARFLENTSDAVIIADSGVRIVEVNEAFTKITGYSREDVIGKIPLFLESDFHDADFYGGVLDDVGREGRWQGEVRARKQSGEVCPLWLSISSVAGDEGELTHYVAICSDISAIKQTEERLEHLAHYDPLTGLPNRTLFNDRLHHTIAFARRRGRMVALILFDLDRFKEVNDTLGHRIGDQLLVAVSKRLKHGMRDSDTISRLGGDEFAIILADVEGFGPAAKVAQHFLNYLAEPFIIEGHEVYITASIGITIYPTDSEDIDALLKNADTAMYCAKERGKNNFQFFTSEMNNRILEKLFIESRLRHALENGEFSVCFQPQVETSTEEIVGVEALARWTNPELGEVPPSKFIPIAEDTGLIAAMGEWVLREACMKSQAWREEGLHPMTVSVNLSARQFHRQNLVETISSIIEETGIDAKCLELEITESVIMQDVEDTVETLKRLKKLGVRLSIDDFGTGYSSLSYLKRFPIEVLKIDQSFVSDITGDSEESSVVSAIIALAHSLDLKVVAEGVETKEQLDFLRGKGCDRIQGYYYMKPLPDEEIRSLLRRSPVSSSGRRTGRILSDES